MSRLGLAILLPLLSVILVAAIGIPMGLLFLWTHHAWNHDVTLVVATVLTAVIMIVATILSIAAGRDESETAPAAHGRSADQGDIIVRPDHDK